MGKIKIVFNRVMLFRLVVSKIASVVVSSSSGVGVERVCMGRDDYGTFEMLLDMADANVRGCVAHLIDDDRTPVMPCGRCADESLLGVGIKEAAGTLSYRLELTHPMQRKMLPAAMERMMVATIAREWFRLRSAATAYDVGFETARDELKHISLMRERNRRPYSYC